MIAFFLVCIAGYIIVMLLVVTGKTVQLIEEGDEKYRCNDSQDELAYKEMLRTQYGYQSKNE